MVSPQTMTCLSTAMGADQAMFYLKKHLKLIGYFGLHPFGGSWRS